MSQHLNPYKLFHGSFIPNWLLSRSEVSANAKLLYARLGQFAGQDGACYPGIDRLSQELGFSISTIKRALTELEKSNLIEHKRRGLGQTNVYYFLEHPWMVYKSNGPNMASPKVPKVHGSSVTPNSPTPTSPDGSGMASVDGSSVIPVDGPTLNRKYNQSNIIREYNQDKDNQEEYNQIYPEDELSDSDPDVEFNSYKAALEIDKMQWHEE